MARMVQRILMVCLGNICRSPTAEAVLRRRAAARGIEVEVDSAGTGSWHVGKPPHPPMIAAAQARGYDLTPLRARQVTARDFDRFDLILAMDRQNHADLNAIAPREGGAELRLFLSGVSGAPKDVPDPYYTGGFDKVIDLAEAGCDALLDRLDQARQ